MSYFKNLERNKSLRDQILTYLVSSFMTDDERAELLGLPEGCRIRENAKILSPEKFECGKYVWIGEGAILDASGGLEIGAHTSIGLYCLIWTHSSVLNNLTLNNIIGNELIERKKTKIGKGCFFGGHCVVYPGVTIGDKVIAMPHSVITKNVADYKIVAGSPAKVIKEIDEKYIQEMVNKIKGNNIDQADNDLLKT